MGQAPEFHLDGPVLGRHGTGIRRPAADGHQGQRRHAQPVGFAAQADVHAELGVSGAGAQAGQQAASGTATGRHKRQQPGRLRSVFQVRRRGRRVPAQPHGVLRGEQVRQSIRVVAPCPRHGA